MQHSGLQYMVCNRGYSVNMLLKSRLHLVQSKYDNERMTRMVYRYIHISLFLHGNKILNLTTLALTADLFLFLVRSGLQVSLDEYMF